MSSVCLCHHHQHGKQTQTRQGSSAKRLSSRKAICSSRRKEWRPSMTPKHTSHKCRPASLRGFSPRRTVPPVWPTPLYCAFDRPRLSRSIMTRLVNNGEYAAGGRRIACTSLDSDVETNWTVRSCTYIWRWPFSPAFDIRCSRHSSAHPAQSASCVLGRNRVLTAGSVHGIGHGSHIDQRGLFRFAYHIQPDSRRFHYMSVHVSARQ